jgi:sarcosine oxidase delta subunit
MILGEYKREIATQKLMNVPCESCGADQLYVKVFSKFFVLGLPAFPTGKDIEIQCSQCQKRNSINFRTQKSAADKVQRIVDQSKHKWYSYLLLIIFGVGSVYVLLTKTDEFKQEMGIKPKTVTPVYSSSSEIEVESPDEINVEPIEEVVIESALNRYQAINNATSDTPEHEAAQYLKTLFDADIKTNSDKGFELEAASDEKKLLLVCYVPNIDKSTQKAKEELLHYTTTALQNKWGYTEFYLAFYGYDMNLYALKANNYERTNSIGLDYIEENKLYQFFE